MSKKIIIAVFTITTLVCVGYFIISMNEDSAPKRESFVVGLKVYEKEISNKIEALGTTYANESITITSNTTETIKEINFTDGQQVKKGDVIAVLDQSAELARLAAINARLAENQRELKRIENLLANKAATKREYDERKTSLQVSRQETKEVQAEIDKRTLIAPFDGVVGIRRLSVGALVQPGDIITTLDDTNTIKLDFTVPSIYLSKLEIGLPVLARSEALGDNIYEGKVISINTRVDPVTRSILVRAIIENDNGKIKPGMLMNLTVMDENRQAVVIPEEAIIQKGSKHFVFVINDNKVAQKEIEIGVRQNGIVEVTKGLKAQETIVVRGMGEVRDGQEVTVKEVWDTIQNSQFEEQ